MGKCVKCGASLDASQTYEWAGETLCEDCWLERKMKPVACDPWAVYSARNFRTRALQLTDIQTTILELLRSSGPIEAADICEKLSLSEDAFQSNFATLRHMELAKAYNRGGRVFFTLF